MTKYLTQNQAIKVYRTHRVRDANTRLMHKAFVKLMLIAARQEHIDNMYKMMAGELSIEMTRRRASRNSALLRRPFMPEVGRVLSSSKVGE